MIFDDNVNGATVNALVGIPANSLIIPIEYTKNNIKYNVTNIGDNSFHFVTGFSYVYIPKTIKKIGDYAFCGTSLVSVSIPSSVEIISSYAFSNCFNLSVVKIMNGVKVIKKGAFLNVGINHFASNIFIPSSVETIEQEAFQSNISSFFIESSSPVTYNQATNEGWYYDNSNSDFNQIAINVFWNSFIKDDFVYGLLDDGTYAVSLLNIGISDINVLGEINNIPVTKVVNFGFRGANISLKSIQLPESIKIIDNEAFYGCINLKSIFIPKNVEEIGDYAFSKCISFRLITIPSSVLKMGYFVFLDCIMLFEIRVISYNSKPLERKDSWDNTNTQTIVRWNYSG